MAGDVPDFYEATQKAYEEGYDDAKSEPCLMCQKLRRLTINACTEMIEFLESIDGVTVVESVDEANRSWTTVEAGEKIKAFKALRAYMEYGS